MADDSSVPQRALVTGGAGFIGSALVRHLVGRYPHWQVMNLDALTYAGNLDSLATVADEPNYHFIQADITDRKALDRAFADFKPTLVFHLAAESHVDRSIDGAEQFIQTNVMGTFHLLEAALAYFKSLGKSEAGHFRFLHVSTDEVFGDLERDDPAFAETNAYAPSSPYSASKAGSDHLVNAWHRTFRLPILMTNCSNNYGPFQFPEKLIPLIINRALNGQELPVYGDGRQIRDWLFVDDHVSGLVTVALKGDPGESYNIGGNSERENIDVVKTLCSTLTELTGSGIDYSQQISFVTDRPGHDRRYAIDANKILNQLQWTPQQTFESGIRETVQWYLDNTAWTERVLSGAYRMERIGRGAA